MGGATEDLYRISRGVPLMKRSLYDPNIQTFSCLDGSRVIPVRQVNDDYCDCKDGSDEPGTSACPQGSFYCPNRLYKPLVIPSSRVNDGICDCCDGSDEWRGVVLCSNICADLGKVLREEAVKELEMKRSGWAKRLEYSTNGRKENEDRKLKVEELKQKKDSLEKERDAAAAAKEEIEAREKEAKDKYEAEWEAMKAVKRKELQKQAAEKAFLALDTSEDGVLSVSELHGRHDLDLDGNGELSAEEAASLLGEGVNLESFLIDVWPKIETKYKPAADIHIETHLPESVDSVDSPASIDSASLSSTDALPSSPEADDSVQPAVEVGEQDSVQPAVEVGEEAPQPTVETLEEEEDHPDDIPEDDHLMEGIDDAFGGGSRQHEEDEDEDERRGDEEEEDDKYDYPEDDEDLDDEELNDDHVPEEESPRPPPPLEQPPKEFASKDDEDETLGLVKPEMDEDTRAKIAAAEEARKAFQMVDDQFRDLEREIHSLDKVVGLDLGRAFEFASLHGKCLEYTDREYVYKVCMYDRASQRPKDGGGETNLGTFTGWENDYLLMKYENGQGCWNGPNRSAKVVLSCGVEDKLTAVSEPSRCEYDFRMTTPAVCDKPDEEEEEQESARTAPPDSLGRDEL